MSGIRAIRNMTGGSKKFAGDWQRHPLVFGSCAQSSMKQTKNQKKESDAPKKRGNKGDFHGQHEEFLISRLDDYLEVSKKKTTPVFFSKLFFNYWLRFPWTLAIDEEPTSETPVDVRLDVLLSEADHEAKTKVLAHMELKIRSWFQYRKGWVAGGNPFTPWLVHIAKSAAGLPPHRLVEYQAYMQDEHYGVKVKEAFEKEHPDKVHVRDAVNLRGAVARWLQEESDEVRAEMRNEVQREYEEAMKEFKSGRGEVTELGTDEADMARARELLMPTVAPLLEMLAVQTGYHFTLLAGRIDRPNFDLKTINVGKTKEGKGQKALDFTSWDPKGYAANVAPQFMRFLLATAAKPNESKVSSSGQGAPATPSVPAATPNVPAATPSAPTDATSTLVEGDISGQPALPARPGMPTDAECRAQGGAPPHMQGASRKGQMAMPEPDKQRQRLHELQRMLEYS
ncbi:hypothetical protein C8J57DRAFT_1533846 [Mycena rebaudengoi]|nr:hypothetical protein C8J57DRAFT_1533846 [Mycena rebaudengoi]